jgi:putative hydrolase of the HAD superfamily
MTIKAILFDLDDTLWPVGPVIRRAEQALHDWLAVHTPQVTAAYDIEGLRRRRQALVPTDPRFSYDLWSLRHRLLQDVMTEQGADPAHADAAMRYSHTPEIRSVCMTMFCQCCSNCRRISLPARYPTVSPI